MLHQEKAPPKWKMSPPELPMPMITPNALQLMATTEFANLNSVHSLNPHMSTLIDMSHLSHLEDVWHIDSSASNYIIRDQNNFSDYYFIPIILFNVLHIPRITTNLISIQKLDLKRIYWRLDN